MMKNITEKSEGVTETEIFFSAKDGFPLSGRLVVPDRPRIGVLLSPGVGFSKEFYLRFARFGAQHGAACLLFDYRGVGSSAPKELKSFKMDFSDWGRLDMPAALDRLNTEFPTIPLVHVGHSIGGNFLGFMP